MPNDIRAFDPAASVFASANAGAGKTSLLTGRVLSLLLRGAVPSSILCLTFTKAAAAEMSNRILQQLGAWVMMEEKTLAASLASLLGQAPSDELLARSRSLFAQVLESPEGVRIQTIHSFCQSILKRFPIEASVNPHFSLTDPATEREMLGEARTRLFNRAREGDHSLQRAIHALAHALSEQGLHELLDEIIAHKRKFTVLFAQPGGLEAAAERVWQAVGIPGGTSREALVEKYFDYNAAVLEQLHATLPLLLQGSPTDIKTGEQIAHWLEFKAQRAATAERYISVFITKEGTRRDTKGMFTKKTIKDVAMLEVLLAEQERVAHFHQALKACEVAQYSVHVMRVAQSLLSMYDGLKRAYARLDYDDLIVQASTLLQRGGIAPWILFKLDGGIDHVLVDEAQDTSPEQWHIIRALTEEFFPAMAVAGMTVRYSW